MNRLGRAVVRVPDLERAISFYSDAFGFSVIFDRELFPGFRSVHVGPGGVQDAGVWLFPDPGATSADEPCLVIHTDAFDADFARLRAAAPIEHSEVTGDAGERSVTVRDSGGNVVVLAEV